MKKFSSRLWLLVAVALLIALGTIGTGANPAHAAQMVPFSGSYSGTARFTGPSSAAFSGTGIATYLGSSTNSGAVVITGSVGPGPVCANGGLPNTNTETFTAANGDVLVITSTDVACVIDPSNLYRFHGTGNWVVTGGTGRFSGATGSGTLDGQGYFDLGTFSFQATGVISAPNGS
jgi:hypothetical protein